MYLSRIKRSLFLLISASSAVLMSLNPSFARDITIQVWAGGSNVNDAYRVDAIVMAADILEKEAVIRGENLNITVETKYDFDGWGGFKQAVTLAAEAKKAPHIVVTGHGDIAPWSQSGLIRPIENYVDFDSWPLSDLFENLVEISSYEGVIYGVPQDAESRPFFAWIPHLKAIGYSDSDIRALPGKVQRKEYTLENVLEDAKKIQDAGLVKPGYGWYPRVSRGGDYWQFYQSFGGEMLDQKSGKLIFDRSAMKNFYAFFVKAVEMGITRKNHIGTPWDQWYSEVASGNAGLWHGGTWHYARYTGKEKLDDFFGKIMFSLIPAGDDRGRPNTITHPLVYLITNRGSEADAEIAAQLVAIASEPRINTLHAIKSAHLGIAKSQLQIPLYANDRWATEATNRLLPYASAQPNHTGFSPYFDAMWKGLEASWTGQKTPEEAVSDVEIELRANLGKDIIIR